MVRYCFVAMCKSTRYKAKGAENSAHVPLYSFPSNPELREKWVQALISMNNQENALNLPKNAAICVEHFEKHCLHKIGLSPVRLKPHSVPTIFPRAVNKWNSNKLSSENCHEDNVQEQSLKIIDIPSTSNKQTQTVSDTQETPCIPIKRKIRYPGDISDDVLEKMSPISLRNCISKLKGVCQKKDHKIKQLQSRQNRQKKKIESLQKLLSDFNKKNSLFLNKLRYPGDISDDVLQNMSPTSLRNCISILKKFCVNKDRKIRLLQSLQNCQRKKIESLQHLLLDFNKNNLLSSNEHKMRYSGEVSDDLIEKISPRSLRNCTLLKEICQKQDHKIKQLQSYQNRQRETIESLQQVLSDLNKNESHSSDTYVIQPENKCDLELANLELPIVKEEFDCKPFIQHNSFT